MEQDMVAVAVLARPGGARQQRPEPHSSKSWHMLYRAHSCRLRPSPTQNSSRWCCCEWFWHPPSNDTVNLPACNRKQQP